LREEKLKGGTFLTTERMLQRGFLRRAGQAALGGGLLYTVGLHCFRRIIGCKGRRYEDRRREDRSSRSIWQIDLTDDIEINIEKIAVFIQRSNLHRIGILAF
jgi:hypothetical protein